MVKAYEQDAVNYNNIGINLTKKANYEQAINYFKKAIESDTSLTNAYYNLGSVYKHTGQKEKAIKTFHLLLRNDPTDDEAAFLLANLYYEKKDIEKALIYLNSLEKSSPHYKAAMELFKKINSDINASVIKDSNSLTKASKMTIQNFQGPTGITEDNEGNLYVANYANDSIQVISPEGKFVKLIKNDLIKGPVGLVTDSANNLYIANYLANNILKITPSGEIKVFMSSIFKPYYLYLNKSGVLFVSEQDKNTVIRVGSID